MPVQQALPDQQALLSPDDGSEFRLQRVPDLFGPYDDDLPPDDIPGNSRPDGARGFIGIRVPQPTWPAAHEGTPGRELAAEPPRTAGTGVWPERFARMLTEALAGSRPARHVLPWTSKRARHQFHRLSPVFGSGRRPRIVRVVISRPVPDVIEMTVIAAFGPRTRAVAVRLERTGGEESPLCPGQAAAQPPRQADLAATISGGWVCTDIEAA